MSRRRSAILAGAAAGLERGVQNMMKIQMARRDLDSKKESADLDLSIKKLKLKQMEKDPGVSLAQVLGYENKLKTDTQLSNAQFAKGKQIIDTKEESERQGINMNKVVVDKFTFDTREGAKVTANVRSQADLLKEEQAAISRQRLRSSQQTSGFFDDPDVAAVVNGGGQAQRNGQAAAQVQPAQAQAQPRTAQEEFVTTGRTKDEFGQVKGTTETNLAAERAKIASKEIVTPMAKKAGQAIAAVPDIAVVFNQFEGAVKQLQEKQPSALEGSMFGEISRKGFALTKKFRQDELDKVVAFQQNAPVLARKLAKASGEVRISDQDAEAFLNAIMNFEKNALSVNINLAQAQLDGIKANALAAGIDTANNPSIQMMESMLETMRVGGETGQEAKEFNSIEEAENSNLPAGTEIIINGRRAIIE